jgi:hypothetical protein
MYPDVHADATLLPDVNCHPELDSLAIFTRKVI